MKLSGVVEFDELYLVAGHKGQPEKVKLANRPPRKRRLKGARGRGTLVNEKPPVFGMSQRSGEVVMRMLENVKQTTIEPLILKTVSQGTQIYTDEYVIYSRLEDWGFQHKTVNIPTPSRAFGHYYDLGCVLIEVFHRINLSFFGFVHNARKRGKRLLSALLETLLSKILESI